MSDRKYSREEIRQHLAITESLGATNTPAIIRQLLAEVDELKDELKSLIADNRSSYGLDACD